MIQASRQRQLSLGIADASPQYQYLSVPVDQALRLSKGDAEYLSGFITIDEEAGLLARVDVMPWLTDLRRRVQHYGYRYDYAERSVKAGHWLGDLPSWGAEISNRLVQAGIFDVPPNQMIVNEYEPGQGIAPHTDREGFGPVIASLSLGSDCMMRIIPCRKGQRDAFDIVLQRCSLLILRGPSRASWRHGILPRRSDRQDGHVFKRGRRVSLTFRTVGD